MPRNPIPSYRRHPRNNRAVVDVYDASGRRTQRSLPGDYGSPESKRAYQELISQLQFHGGQLPDMPGQRSPDDLTINELILRFLDVKVAVDYVDAAGQGQGQEKSIYDAQSEPSFPLYSHLAQTGDLYDYLLVKLADRNIFMPREDLKKRFLADVIAKKKVGRRGAEYPSIVEHVFAENFPDVYCLIREINDGGWHHENLIRELQRLESSFVIEIVAADLVTRHPNLVVITLHDAIYTTPDGVDLVVQGLERGFEEFGLRMSYKASDA